MNDKDKTTVKVGHYSQVHKSAPHSNLTEAQTSALELVKKIAQLEEEKHKSSEHLETIERLQENLKQEQATAAEMARKITELEAKVGELARLKSKVKEFAQLEAKVKELTEVLGKISGIAAAGKAG